MYFLRIIKQLKGEFRFIARYPRDEFHIEDTRSKVDHVFRTFCHTFTQLSAEHIKKRLKYQADSVITTIR